jgi:adenosylhomocysteinase
MKDIIVKRHFESMKDGAVICNTGHYDCEIAIPDLEEMAISVRNIRTDNEEFSLPDGRHLFLLARGRLVNLAAAEGHPSEVMDMSFANQFLSLCRLAAEGRDYDNKVYDITDIQDRDLAALKLAAEGIQIDSLSAEQTTYATDFSAGT